MPIADTSVRTYLSTMTGAPTLSGTAGTLITLLDNCLINGFGSVTLNSLVVGSNVATATVNTGHGFSMIGGSGGVGPVIRIAGATPSTLNRDWRIASVPNSTTFTFVTADISDQTATGTITAKIAPADWEKRYSGTNKAAYARTDEDATAMLLRVDDSGTTTAQVRGYEEMTDIDNGAGLFPTIAQVATASGLWNKNTNWVLVVDSKRMAFFPLYAATYRNVLLFGDLIPYLTGDAYHCLLALYIGDSYSYPQTTVLWNQGSGYPPYMARGLAQLGSAVSLKTFAGMLLNQIGSAGGVAYPNPANNALLFRGDVEFAEVTANAMRGRWPGLLPPLHVNPGTDLDVVAGLSGGRAAMLLRVGAVQATTALMGTVAVDLLDWT